MTADKTSRPIDPKIRISRMHLKVADLERALRFYCGVLGFELTQRYGAQAAFVSAGGYHHHIGLNAWESLGGSPPPAGATGLYHVAILYPTRRALADALRRVLDAEIPLDGASDHGVSEALYLRDPDDNGVELYWDRSPDVWPRTPRGELAMATRRLDLNGLLAELPAEPSATNTLPYGSGPRTCERHPSAWMGVHTTSPLASAESPRVSATLRQGQRPSSQCRAARDHRRTNSPSRRLE